MQKAFFFEEFSLDLSDSTMCILPVNRQIFPILLCSSYRVCGCISHRFVLFLVSFYGCSFPVVLLLASRRQTALSMRALTEYNNRDQVGRVNMFLIFNIENSLSSPRGLFISPENMHNKVCKMALGVHSKASNHAVKGELDVFLFILLFTLEFYLPYKINKF